MPRYKIANILFVSVLAALVVADVLSGISMAWYLLLVGVYGSVCATGAFVLSAGFFLTAVCRGNRQQKKRIAITFDDGPIHGHTGRILDILAMYKVPATFFCIGSRVEQNKELLVRIDAANHLVGNHSYYHKNTFGFLSAKEVARELYDTDRVIGAVLKKKPRFFRPPYGVTNPMIAAAVSAGGYRTVGWSIRSFDTIIRNTDRLLKRTTVSLSPGDIVLFHDYSESMIGILPKFIEIARNKGFEIVRLDELLNEEAYR